MTPSLPSAAIVVKLRAVFPSTMGIYAFGSQAQGTARPDSDWDLALLVPGYVNPLTRLG